MLPADDQPFFYLSVVVSLPLWLTTTDDGFLVGRQPEALCVSKLGRADDADKDWRSLKKRRSFNFKSYRGCVIMKLTYHSVILSKAKDLESSSLCIQILHFVQNDTKIKWMYQIRIHFIFLYYPTNGHKWDLL